MAKLEATMPKKGKAAAEEKEAEPEGDPSVTLAIIQTEGLADEEMIRKDLQASGFRIKRQTLVKLNEDKAVKYLKIPYSMRVAAVKRAYRQYERDCEDAELEGLPLPDRPEVSMPDELTPDELEEILSRAKEYCRGPMLVLELEKVNAVEDWTTLLGTEEDASIPIAEDEGEQEEKDGDDEKVGPIWLHTTGVMNSC